MTKRILIAGCGKIGSAVAVELAAFGYQVTGLRRTAQEAGKGVQYQQADLTDPETLCRLPTDYDLLLVIVTPSDYSEEGYRAIYLDGVGHLLAHFSNSGNSPQIIYVSSTRVYGQSKGEWVNEDSQTIPTDERGRILLAAEQQVLGFGDQNNTVVRFSGIYGPDSQFMQRIAAQNKPVQFSPSYYTNRVHRKDCVGSLVLLVQKALSGASLAKHYLVSDNEPATKWDVVNWVAGQAGLQSPNKGESDVNAEQGKRCDNQRIRDAGYCFKYPTYREGYKVN